MKTSIEELVPIMRREAASINDLADFYRYDNELHTQYSAQAQTWTAAARMVERALKDD